MTKKKTKITMDNSPTVEAMLAYAKALPPFEREVLLTVLQHKMMREELDVLKKEVGQIKKELATLRAQTQ